MAKILIEWRRAGHTYGTQELIAVGAAVQSEAAPNFGGLSGHAIVTVLEGACFILAGENPTATAETGRYAYAGGDPKMLIVETGWKISVLEEADAPSAAAGPAPAAPKTATILGGQSLSGAIDLGDQRLHRIDMPAAWTAAAITFQVSHDGVNWKDLFVSGGELSLPTPHVAENRSIVVDAWPFFGVRYVKIRSGAAAAAVPQGAQRDLVLVTVPR